MHIAKTSGEGVFSARLHGIFAARWTRRSFWRTPDDVAEIAERLDEGAPLVEHVVTLGSIIPETSGTSAKKIELLADIRRLACLRLIV